MDEKIKQWIAKAKQLFTGMNKKVKRLLLAALGTILALVLVLLVYRFTRPYEVLFTGLSSDDMTAILQYLDSNGVSDYKIQNNNTILVPSSQADNLKAKVWLNAYPNSGFGYDVYLDNVGALSSDSDRIQLALFQLQENLAAVIRNFDNVQDATVNIAMGEDHRYILSSDDVVEASAFVFVTMEGSSTLTAQQAKAIRSGVANAVQGLQIDNITITDAAGNEYAGGDIANASESSQLKMALEAQVNANVRSNVMAVLAPLFGLENISVSVNSTVDVSRTYKDSTIYEEPDWAADGSTGGRGIIGSQVWNNDYTRNDDGTVGGVAGTTTNADLNEYQVNQGEPPADASQYSNSGEIDYDNTTHRIQSETPGGVVTDVMVAVAIDSTMVTLPETQNLIGLVARAAGIDAAVQSDKISILAHPFYNQANANANEAALARLRQNILIFVIIGVVLILLLLLVLLLLRRKRKKKEAEQPVVEEVPVLKPEQVKKGADIMDMDTERSMELRKDVRQFAQDNPEIAAQLVKTWLRGGDEEHG